MKDVTFWLLTGLLMLVALFSYILPLFGAPTWIPPAISLAIQLAFASSCFLHPVKTWHVLAHVGSVTVGTLSLLVSLEMCSLRSLLGC